MGILLILTPQGPYIHYPLIFPHLSGLLSNQDALKVTLLICHGVLEGRFENANHFPVEWCNLFLGEDGKLLLLVGPNDIEEGKALLGL